jgi:hypothetical protein
MPRRDAGGSGVHPADSAVVSDHVNRFEEAWESSQQQDLGAFLPQASLRRTVLVELVHIDLERRLKAGQAARVEDYLGRFMVRCPFPTYLVGVDEPNDRAYVVSIHGNLRGPITSMPSRYPLTPRNLRRLWEEVTAYWMKLNAAAKESAFVYKDWPSCLKKRPNARSSSRKGPGPSR